MRRARKELRQKRKYRVGFSKYFIGSSEGWVKETKNKGLLTCVTIGPARDRGVSFHHLGAREMLIKTGVGGNMNHRRSSRDVVFVGIHVEFGGKRSSLAHEGGNPYLRGVSKGSVYQKKEQNGRLLARVGEYGARGRVTRKRCVTVTLARGIL